MFQKISKKVINVQRLTSVKETKIVNKEEKNHKKNLQLAEDE
jgi:hypothetical protein